MSFLPKPLHNGYSLSKPFWFCIPKLVLTELESFDKNSRHWFKKNLLFLINWVFLNYQYDLADIDDKNTKHRRVYSGDQDFWTFTILFKKT